MGYKSGRNDIDGDVVINSRTANSTGGGSGITALTRLRSYGTLRD